jgi:predicted CXXCH cytochrome family protein
VDGNQESPQAYGLCYGCHDRELVLGGIPFPDHARHIVDYRAACATCHNPHGSVDNRALIRFGEETQLSGVTASASTGRLAYVSEVQGSGACYLTCHGYDHAPASYGMEAQMGITADGLLHEGSVRGRGAARDPGRAERIAPGARKEQRRTP